MWGILAFVVGILYGWLKPGTQDKSKMLLHGLVIGLVVGFVLAVLGVIAFGSNPIGLGSGFLGVVLGALLVTMLFVLGVWIGDLIEAKAHRTP